MDPDDNVCLCFHVPLRKIRAYLAREDPPVASLISECLGAGTGCRWCVPFLKHLHAQHQAGIVPDLGISPQRYAEARSGYRETGTRPEDVTPGTDLSRRTLKISGRDVYCEVTGPESGLPILFVHGFPLSGRMWDSTVVDLVGSSATAAFRCIVPDLRGHGRSAATAGAGVTIAELAEDLAGVLDAIGETRPVVYVGLSMGGIVGFEFWRRFPGRVRAMAIVCSRATAETPEGRPKRDALATAVLDPAGRGAIEAADVMVSLALSPTVDPDLSARVHALMAENSAEGIAAMSLALRDRPDSLATLPTITVPTLYIAGSDDRITGPDVLRDMHQRTPGSRLEVIQGAGHLPPMERPGSFGEVLLTFLRSVSGNVAG